MAGQRWIHVSGTYRDGGRVRRSATGTRAHWRRGGRVKGYWKQVPVHPRCMTKDHDPGLGEQFDMALTMLDRPEALADPLAWMELLGYLSPAARRTLALLLLLPPSSFAALSGIWAGTGWSVLQSIAFGTFGGVLGPVLLVLALFARSKRRAARSR